MEPIRELVATLPIYLEVAYVVQHMSPHHKSYMTVLLTRQTNLVLRDVRDGIEPEPNVIYVASPKTDIIFDNCCLRSVKSGHGVGAPKPSVDGFLLSIAGFHGEKSMAVIQSGTGTDGANGVQAIGKAGGITIAQDTESAKYDGIPMAVKQTGCVGLVLPPFENGTYLRKILTSAMHFDALRQNPSETASNHSFS